jgi:predicted nucleic acid-binding protein
VLVFDASSLILLARIEILEMFLEDSKIDAVMPGTVMKEVFEHEKEETPLIKALIKDGKIRIQHLKRTAEISRLIADFSLHRGEAEAVYLAFQQGDFVITDDRNAMRLCRLLKVPFLTAIAVLVRLCEKGTLDQKISLAKLERLEKFGRYRNEIIAQARKQIQGDSHGK